MTTVPYWQRDNVMRRVGYTMPAALMEKLQSRNDNIADKKYANNAHMVTVGLNFHF